MHAHVAARVCARKTLTIIKIIDLGSKKDFNVDFPGLWAASFNLGNFVGPTASGFLVEALGFRSSTMIFFVLYIFMGMADAIELTCNMKNNKKEEYERLT